MQLTAEAVRELAHGARIALSDEELPEITRELNAIVESLEPITHFSLDGVEPTFSPLAGLSNIMREDVAEKGFTQEEAVAQAPASLDGQFVIPPILTDEGGDR